MFCKYKNIFNEPRKGIHSYRIFNIAIIDVIATIISAYIYYILIHKKYSIYNYNLLKYIIILFLLGIFFHWLFCVDTTVMKYIKNFYYI
jgi:hypothetical protein